MEDRRHQGETRIGPITGKAPDGIELASSIGAICAESPLRDHRAASLCWTDIDGRRLYRWEGRGRPPSSRRMFGRVGCFALHASGGFVAAIEDRVVILDAEFNLGETLGTAGLHPRIERFNDGDGQEWRAFLGRQHLPAARSQVGRQLAPVA